MHCVENCIPKLFQLKAEELAQAEIVGQDLGYYRTTGRPPMDITSVLQALFYLVRTGMQWCALPRCLGASSTIHAAFQRLRDIGFFDNFHLEGLDQYEQKIGIDHERRVGDCIHIKSPLGDDGVGPSPVDRRKQGTKRSMITDGNGVILGCAVGPGNKNDTKLFERTVQSIPTQFQSNGDQECWLDAIYDTREVRAICFKYGLKPRISRHPRRKRAEPVRPLPKGVRWVVERSHSWINRFRRLFVRFDKIVDNYLAFIKFAAAINVFRRLGVSG